MLPSLKTLHLVWVPEDLASFATHSKQPDAGDLVHDFRTPVHHRGMATSIDITWHFTKLLISEQLPGRCDREFAGPLQSPDPNPSERLWEVDELEIIVNVQPTKSAAAVWCHLVNTA